MTSSSALVPRLLTVTLAPGTAAPLASVTVPPMAPSVVDCAKPPDVHKNNAMIIAMDTKHALKRKNPVSFSRMDIPPREHMERCAASTYSALSRGVKGWLPCADHGGPDSEENPRPRERDSQRFSGRTAAPRQRAEGRSVLPCRPRAEHSRRRFL